MASFSFNTIYIIESLDPNKDKNTGLSLKENLDLRTYVHKHLTVEHYPAISKIALLQAFDKIKKHIQETDALPFLHLEIHGDEELRGLITENKELVTWSKFGNN